MQCNVHSKCESNKYLCTLKVTVKATFTLILFFIVQALCSEGFEQEQEMSRLHRPHKNYITKVNI